MKLQSSFARIGKRIAIAATFGVLCFVVGAPSAQAEDRNACQVRIERAEHRLNHAIHDRGYYSRQANDRRRDLNREQERCWNQSQGYWNGGDRQWHNDRNWDRNDRNNNRYDRGNNRDRDDRNRDRDGGNRYQDHYYNRDSR